MSGSAPSATGRRAERRLVSDFPDDEVGMGVDPSEKAAVAIDGGLKGRSAVPDRWQ